MATNNNSNGGRYDARKYVAELLGTMALVFFGCGAAVLAGKYIGFLGISFAFGMVVLVMVYAIGPISGCHINPAITIAMLLARKISVKDGVIYIIVQCIGAILGAEMLLWIALGMPGYKVGLNGLGQNGFDAFSPGLFTLQAGLVAEVTLTFFFLLAIFGATSKQAPKGFAGVGIGFTLFIVHLVGIPVTGTSVNPARSLGPALILAVNGSGDALNQLWLFWLAPIIGAVLAAAVWVLVLSPDETQPAAPEPPRKIKMKGAPMKPTPKERPAAEERPKAKDEDEGEDEEEEDLEDKEEEEDLDDDKEDKDEEEEDLEDEDEEEEVKAKEKPKKKR